ncbi:MAG TPA: mercuric reductase [Burkholderiaceae bacterium]|nr:mercuric reductase [Burkholderiaceae bacterium]
MKEFDVVIIGAGQAGPTLSKSLAQAGRSVALVERKQMGGSCVNFGCTPTKAALASARVAWLARRAIDFGVNVTGVQPDFAAVLARAEGIVQRARASLEESFAGHDNPALIHGHARFVARDGERFRLAVGDEEIIAVQVVLDTGTRSAVPLIDGVHDIDYLTAENWLQHRTLPQHLALVGGGYIGLEMAQFYRRMGADVTVIESGAQVAAQEDPEVAAALQQVLEGEGIRFRLNAKATRCRKTANGVTLTCDNDGKTDEIAATDLFIALGRKPNTDDLGLETIGLHPTAKGTLEVDQRLSTGIPGVWAVGDIRGGPMFTHTAWDDYRIVESQLVGDKSRSTDRIVPYAVFTDPALGRVGMTETQARRAGKNIKVARFDMKGNGRAIETGETGGFIKVVIDAGNQRILGASVLAAEGAELVHIYVVLMNADAPYTVLENAIQIHPTLAEAVQSAVSSLR